MGRGKLALRPFRAKSDKPSQNSIEGRESCDYILVGDSLVIIVIRIGRGIADLGPLGVHERSEVDLYRVLVDSDVERWDQDPVCVGIASLLFNSVGVVNECALVVVGFGGTESDSRFGSACVGVEGVRVPARSCRGIAVSVGNDRHREHMGLGVGG